MKGEKAIQYLANRVAELERDKAILLAQMAELSEQVEMMKKEVEQIGSNNNQT